MQLRATLTVDFEAEDFVEAGKYQAELRDGLSALMERYPGCKLEFRERRQRDPASNTNSRIPAVLNRTIVYE